jgi:hypothetical protein
MSAEIVRTWKTTVQPSRLILNGINGRYLREICDNAVLRRDQCTQDVERPVGDAHRNLIVQQLALPGFKSKATEPDRVAAHQLQSQGSDSEHLSS